MADTAYQNENNDTDEIIGTMPIHYSTSMDPHIHLHQFPLLTRRLMVPPKAAASGKRIRARVKPGAHRTEIHVPVDTRLDVWNAEKGSDLGQARLADDRERNQDIGFAKHMEGDDVRLSEVRLASERVPHVGVYMLGVVRDGKLHLHPIQETHQFRPTLTYLDHLSRKDKRSRRTGDDSDSDDGPPPDPDEPVAPVPSPPKKEKKAVEIKEVQTTSRRVEDKNGLQTLGGLSTARREILLKMRAEEDETWQDLEYHDVETDEAQAAFDSLFSQRSEVLTTTTNMTAFLNLVGENVSK